MESMKAMPKNLNTLMNALPKILKVGGSRQRKGKSLGVENLSRNRKVILEQIKAQIQKANKISESFISKFKSNNKVSNNIASEEIKAKIFKENSFLPKMRVYGKSYSKAVVINYVEKQKTQINKLYFTDPKKRNKKKYYHTRSLSTNNAYNYNKFK